MENYCSDLSTSCTIRTPCAGSVQVYLSLVATDLFASGLADKTEHCKKYFDLPTCLAGGHKQLRGPVLNGYTSSYVPPQHENKETNSTDDLLLWFCKTWKQEHVNTQSDTIFNETKTPLYLSGCLLPPHLGCMVLPWGDSGQWRTVLLTGSVSNRNHMIATRCPGTRWTCHEADQSTNITLVSFLYICAQGASSGARVVKVYFWMYSLRSERLAVGARQLWRQHVIVARQPDRPKMAELTGTRFYTYTC